MLNLSRRGVSPVIAIVLLLMMTVAAAGAAYFWITSMQSSVQQSAGSQIEAITKQASTRIIAQATLCKPPAEDDLVGYWKFDQGEGTTAEDSAGGNDGTLNGTSWVNYGERYALDFDGTDDYVELGDILHLDTRDLSISTWIRTTNTLGYVISDTHDRYGGREGYNLAFRGTDKISWTISNGTEFVVYLTSSKVVADGNWHHIIVIDDRSDDCELWVDGKLEDSTDMTDVGDIGGSEGLKFGVTDVWHYFSGKMDEVRIYDKALTGEAAKAAERVDVTVYNAGAEEVPKGAWVANLIKDGNTIESDTYNASSLDSEERITLNFYFSKLHPGGEYTIGLEGTQTSTTVSC